MENHIILSFSIPLGIPISILHIKSCFNRRVDKTQPKFINSFIQHLKQMNKNATLLSVIIPVFNEELTIVDIINRLKTTLQKIGVRNEIIVIDDCSTDKSVVVIGSRFRSETALSVKKFNSAGVRLFNFLIKTLNTASVSDSQSGYRVMKSVVLVNLNLKSGEYQI